MDDLNAILTRTREKVRRERLHREIGALEAKCKQLCDRKPFNWRNRVWKLTSKIKRLNAQLAQPELML